MMKYRLNRRRQEGWMDWLNGVCLGNMIGIGLDDVNQANHSRVGILLMGRGYEAGVDKEMWARGLSAYIDRDHVKRDIVAMSLRVTRVEGDTHTMYSHQAACYCTLLYTGKCVWRSCLQQSRLYWFGFPCVSCTAVLQYITQGRIRVRHLFSNNITLDRCDYSQTYINIW